MEAGYRFWPVVHEIQGGTSKEARAAIQAISEAVAQRESSEPAAVRRELLGRVAAVVARTAARAVQKRSGQRRTRDASGVAKASARRFLSLAEAEAEADPDTDIRD